MKTVSAAEANRNFSKLLREVGAGESVLVTSRGKAVAVIQPAPERAQTSWDEAWKRLAQRLEAQPTLGLPRIDRNELYDD